jgi:hypothetical protein
MKLPITHRHSASFKDAQYRQYEACITRYGSVVPQASLVAWCLTIVYFTKAIFRGSLMNMFTLQVIELVFSKL